MKSSFLLVALLLPMSSAALADARKEVETAFRKVLNDKSYVATITTTDKRRNVTVRMMVELPDRFHMKTDETEIIVLPEGTWMNAAGQWMRSPVNMSQMIASYSADAMEKGIDAIGQVEYIGEETVEGCASKNYRYSQSGEFMGMRSSGDVLLSICQSNGKPIRIVSSQKGKADAATIVYDWDAPVNIRPPR